MGDILLGVDDGLLKRNIDLVVRRTMDMDMTWDWPCGVAYYGISRAYETTGEQDYIDFLAKRVDEHLEIGLPPLMVNAVAMGHCLLSLHQATGEKRFLEVAERKAEYLRNDARRFGARVLQHTVSAGDDFPGQAWADTLFMAAYFLLRMGRFLGRDDYVDDALNQYYWHEELLQDPKTDLFYHGWDEGTKSHLSGMFWARGNAWAALTMSEALKLIDYTYPMFMQIDCALRDQLAALTRLQAPSGLWRTILDEPASYEETSASAGFGTALVNWGNPLHRPAALRALEGVLSRISENGSVLDVSAGTAIMDNKEDYLRVPHKRVQGWGQGLVLAFLCALLERNEKARKEGTK
jgi:unsaturated rhamnogalacturonyl hydrolase